MAARGVVSAGPVARSSIPLGLVRPRAELEEALRETGEPAYRADQVRGWIFARGEADPAAMSDLPRGLRDRLAETAWASRLVPVRVEQDTDGTRKGLLELRGSPGPAVTVESVLIPARDRLTLCLSTQAGCAVGCPFCATGRMGLRRNLKPGEMAGQLLWARQEMGRFPTHVVFMGMGEPLANWAAVRQVVDLLRGPDGFGIGARRLTISTAGVVPGILRLAAEPRLQVNLAVSLHAPLDGLRDRLVPLNRRWPLDALLDAVRVYVRSTGRRVSFEYVMLAGVNDTPELAAALARRLRGLLCHVNLIPYNPVPGSSFQPASDESIARFAGLLLREGVTATVRQARGRSILAACGQLGSSWSLDGRAGGEPSSARRP